MEKTEAGQGPSPQWVLGRVAVGRLDEFLVMRKRA